MAFGSVGRRELGTYFIGYASTPGVIEQMLEHMFIGDPPGNHDRILDVSTAVTGGLFFVPTATFLDDLPPAPDGASQHEPLADDRDAGMRPAHPDGSLQIGSLR
jgi:putative iron-dependent peroxidase